MRPISEIISFALQNAADQRLLPSGIITSAATTSPRSARSRALNAEEAECSGCIEMNRAALGRSDRNEFTNRKLSERNS